MNILYEDPYILVCHKQPGQPVQSANVRCKDICSELKTYLRSKSEKSKQPYLGIIHRLDTGVGGLLVFAKNKKAAARLSGQVTDGTMEKEYLAMVDCEHPESSELLDGKDHLLENYLVRKKNIHMAAVADEHTPGAKRACLNLKKINEGESPLLRIRLLTGRFHQIRCQLSYAGLPIAGDCKYGTLACSSKWQYPCLYAYKLSFIHPTTGKRMSFTIDEKQIPFIEQKE